jgi:acyl carrier protein
VTEAEIYAGLTEVFRDLFGDPTLQLAPETTAADVPGWDSFNHLNIVAGAEERFGVRLGTREVDGLRNVGDLARLILKKRGG